MKHLVISALWLLLALTNSESHSDALKASKKNLLSIVATYKNNHFQRVFKSEKYDFITYTEQPDSASTAHYFFEISTTGYQPDENNSYKKGFYETSMRHLPVRIRHSKKISMRQRLLRMPLSKRGFMRHLPVRIRHSKRISMRQRLLRTR